LFEGHQQGLRAERRLVKVDGDSLAAALPGAHVLAVDGDVAEVLRDLELPLLHRRADDEIVEQDRTVSDAFLERVEVEGVDFNMLAERFDFEFGAVVGGADSIGLLQFFVA